MENLLKILSDTLPESEEDLNQYYIKPASVVMQALANTPLIPGATDNAMLRRTAQLRFAIGVLKHYMNQSSHRHNASEQDRSNGICRFLWIRALVYGITQVNDLSLLPENLRHFCPKDVNRLVSADLHQHYMYERVFLELTRLCYYIEPSNYSDYAELWRSDPKEDTLVQYLVDMHQRFIKQNLLISPELKSYYAPPSNTPNPASIVVENKPSTRTPSKTNHVGFTPAPEGASNKDRLNRALDYIQQQIEQGTWTVNQKGANVHVTPQGPALIVPRVYHEVAIALRSKVDEIEALLADSVVPNQADYGFKKKHPRKKDADPFLRIGLIHLKPGLITLPEGQGSVNPDIDVRALPS